MGRDGKRNENVSAMKSQTKLLIAFLLGALLASFVSWGSTRLKVATLEQRNLLLERDLRWATQRGLSTELELIKCREK